jgi:hypothetical protein
MDWKSEKVGQIIGLKEGFIYNEKLDQSCQRISKNWSSE